MGGEGEEVRILTSHSKLEGQGEGITPSFGIRQIRKRTSILVYKQRRGLE